MNKRIVVTGMGALTPLGCGVEQVWQRLLAGQSGIRRLPEELIGDLPISIGGQVPDRLQDPQAGFDPDALLAPKEQRKMDRFILFALAAAQEALTQAGWAPQTAEAQERTATIIASGVGGFPAIADAVRTTDSKAAPPFAVHHSILPQQYGRRSCVDPAWPEGTAGHTGDGLCRGCPGHR